MHWFFAKSFNTLTIEDIERLVAENVSESLHLEYKQSFTDKREPKEPREFGKDISAFANTEGGDMIVGVREDKKNDTLEIVGVEGKRDELERHVRERARDTIEPHVRIEVKALPWNDKFVVVIRVPRSLDAPHRNEGSNDEKFYRRNPNGVHAMTPTEIRDTVLQRRDMYERAKQWRDERLAMHANGEAPVQMADGPLLFVHGVPIGMPDDALPLHTEVALEIKKAIYHNSFVERDFFGAFVHMSSDQAGRKARFDQWTNSASFEFAREISQDTRDRHKLVSGRNLENEILTGTTNHTKEIQRLCSAAGWLILVSIRDAAGKLLQYYPTEDLDAKYGPLPAFRSNDIRCPPLHVAELPTNEADWLAALKPIFDRIAQSANRDGAPPWRERLDGARRVGHR